MIRYEVKKLVLVQEPSSYLHLKDVPMPRLYGRAFRTEMRSIAVAHISGRDRECVGAQVVQMKLLAGTVD